MSQAEVERFLGRIITDSNFRVRAANSLANTCFGEGIVLSPEELSLLMYIDFSQFAKIAETINNSIRRK